MGNENFKRVEIIYSRNEGKEKWFYKRDRLPNRDRIVKYLEISGNFEIWMIIIVCMKCYKRYWFRIR